MSRREELEAQIAKAQAELAELERRDRMVVVVPALVWGEFGSRLGRAYAGTTDPNTGELLASLAKDMEKLEPQEPGLTRTQAERVLAQLHYCLTVDYQSINHVGISISKALGLGLDWASFGKVEEPYGGDL